MPHVNWLMPLGGGLTGTLPNPQVITDEAGLVIARQVFGPRVAVSSENGMVSDASDLLITVQVFERSNIRIPTVRAGDASVNVTQDALGYILTTTAASPDEAEGILAAQSYLHHPANEGGFVIPPPNDADDLIAAEVYKRPVRHELTVRAGDVSMTVVRDALGYTLTAAAASPDDADGLIAARAYSPRPEPAINPGANYTWTGQHTFTQMATFQNRILITDPGINPFGFDHRLQIITSGEVWADVTVYSSLAQFPTLSLRKAGGTQSSPSAVANNDVLGVLGFDLHDGATGLYQSASVRGLADGTPSSTSHPARIEFWTAPIGSVDEVLRVAIKNDGSVLIYGVVMIGRTSSLGEEYKVQAAGNESAYFDLKAYSSFATIAPAFRLGRARGSQLSPADVQNGDLLGEYTWDARIDGGFQLSVASLRVYVDGTPGATSSPTRFEVYATPDGSSTPVKVTVFTGTGQLQLPVPGGGAGILAGGDALLFRGAANTWYTGSGDGFYIDGDLGVGQLSPSAKLHVNEGDTLTATVAYFDSNHATGAQFNVRHLGTGAANNVVDYVSWLKDSDGNLEPMGLIRTVAVTVTNGSEDSRLEFQTMKAGVRASRLYIATDFVGVGITPSAKFQVSLDASQAVIFGKVDGTEGNFRFLNNVVTDGYHYIQAGKGVSDTVAKLMFSRYQSVSALAEFRVASDATFFSGNVSIGGYFVAQALLHGIVEDAATITPTEVIRLGHNSTGTPATNFAGRARFTLESSTTPDQSAYVIDWTWQTATHISRKASVEHYVYDTVARLVLQFFANGSAPAIGFLGAPAVVRPAAYTQTYTTATRTHANPTAVDPGTYAAGTAGYSTGTLAQALFNSVEALVVDVANAKQVINQIINDLKAYGLLA